MMGLKQFVVFVSLLLVLIHVRAQQPLTGKLVFTRNSAIFLYDFASATERSVIDGLSSVKSPVLSPDGNRIAFYSFQNASFISNIFVINIDGSGLQQVTTGQLAKFDPVWSPNGSKLAYTVAEPTIGSLHNIFTINVDGTNETQITNAGGSRADWSPSGTKLTFMASRNTGFTGVYTINIDGSDEVLITPRVNAFTPKWSPDGSKIALSGIDQQVYYLNADGTGSIQQITDEYDFGEYDWLDNNTIVFGYHGSVGIVYSVVTINVDGTDRAEYPLEMLDIPSDLSLAGIESITFPPIDARAEVKLRILFYQVRQFLKIVENHNLELQDDNDE